MPPTDHIAETLHIEYRIEKHYIGDLRESCRSLEIEKLRKIFGADIALELRGKKLLLFVILVRGAE